MSAVRRAWAAFLTHWRTRPEPQEGCDCGCGGIDVR